MAAAMALVESPAIIMAVLLANMLRRQQAAAMSTAGAKPGSADAASAPYIAVPAVLRHAVPEAQPALCLGMSLGATFPFNILLGIPLYIAVAQWALGG
jgi:hypothetical protein